MLETTDLKERADKAMKYVERGAERVGGALSGFNDDAVKFIRARPGTVLVAALAVGFAIGRFISRR